VRRSGIIQGIMILSEDNFRKRSKVVLSLLFIWIGAAACFLSYFTVIAGGTYIRTGEKLAWRRASFGGVRGRILDSDGVALAWTEQSYSLQVKPPLEDGLCHVLAKIFPGHDFNSADNFEIPHLSPEQISSVAALIANSSRLKLISVEKRITRIEPEVKKLVGEVDGLNGVSGLELLYDEELRPEPGRYAVMLDRHGNWVRGSWRLEAKPVNGADVRAETSLREIIRQGRAVDAK
jgi:cell division protein FtsI/penicillin-binding protein 2